MKIRIKKRYKILIIVFAVLVGLRIYLPYWIKNHINKALANIPNYYGYVNDVDVALIKGTYALKGLYLNKVHAGTKTPYLDFPKSDISIDWSSLIKGHIVSDVEMINPKVTYILEVQEKNASKNASLESWTKALTDIVPFKINNFVVHNGSAAFVEFISKPDIDLHIDKIELTANNLRNIEQKERVLPSPIKATGVSIGNGAFKVEGNINLVKKIPDMDINMALQNVDVTALNTASKYYVDLQFESGDFDLFSEIAIADGYLKGYIKPLLKHSKLNAKGEPILDKLWEGFAVFLKFVLKNHHTDTLATEVVLQGNLKNVKANKWKAFVDIIKNGWIKALKDAPGDTVAFVDAFDKDKKTLKEEAKEQIKTEKLNLAKDSSLTKHQINKEVRLEKKETKKEARNKKKNNG